MFNFLQLFSAVNCWLKCMLLEPYNQTDHPECKSRPDSGLSAITELDPGYITGKLMAYSLFLSTDLASSSHELHICYMIICSLYHKSGYSMLSEKKFILDNIFASFDLKWLK